MAARARAGKPWDAIMVAVDAIATAGCVAAVNTIAKPITFVGFAKEWTDGDLYKKWPDHVAKKDSSEMINRYRRAARTWSELDLGALSPLDTAVPEFVAACGGPRQHEDSLRVIGIAPCIWERRRMGRFQKR